MNTIHRKNDHTAVKLLFRFVSGRDMDGERRTNATFTRRADRDLTKHQRASRWAHKRHAERAAWRLSALCVTVGLVWGYVVDPRATLAAASSASAVGACLAAWRIYIGIRRASHMRKIVTPIYRTVAPLAGHPIGDTPTRYLTIPRDYATNDYAKPRLTLSTEWEGSITQQKAVSGLVTRRLGGDWDCHFHHNAWPPYAEFMRSPKPPTSVTYAEFRAFMDKCAPNVLPVGIGASRAYISLDLDAEAPHLALSVGTGGGKTSTMALFIAFLVKNGVERIDIINTKRVGYSWCVGLPGVYVHNTMAAQMKAIHDVRERMESRYVEIDADETLTFPRNVLIIEEQNSWMKYADQYWADYRQELSATERSKTPRKNPAISDIGFILFMGRQACTNVISIYQRMSASASGGGDMRDQYGAKLIARSSPQAWKILVGIGQMPRDARSGSIRGRAVYVLGDDPHSVQIAYLTTDEAREYALSGNAAVIPDIPSEDDELYSLREIAGNVIPIRYGALRKARQRDRAFPAGIKRSGVTLYRPTDIRDWAGNRVRAHTA